MSRTLAELKALHPEVKWDEPVRFAHGIDGWRYACRICIANKGITGAEIAALPTDPKEIVEHIRREHGPT